MERGLRGLRGLRGMRVLLFIALGLVLEELRVEAFGLGFGAQVEEQLVYGELEIKLKVEGIRRILLTLEDH